MLNVNTTIVFSTVGLIKKTKNKWIKKGGKLEVELDLFNYVTISDIKMQKFLIHQNLLKRLI